MASDRRAWPLLAAGGIVAAVTAGMGAHRQRKLERAGIRLEMHTMAGPALVLDLVDEDGETVRTLVVDGTIESATYLGERRYDLVFDYLRTFDAMFDTGMPISNALMIGGGGYSYPKHLVFHHPETAVDVVEVDPAITRIARRHFFLDDLIRECGRAGSERLRSFSGDGRAFLDGTSGRPRYDAILNDSFSGHHPAASLATAEAARSVRTRLVEGGLYLVNVVSATEGPESLMLQATLRTLAEVFSHVHAIPCDPSNPSASDNVIVVATDASCSFLGETGVIDASHAPVITDDNAEDLLLALLS